MNKRDLIRHELIQLYQKRRELIEQSNQEQEVSQFPSELADDGANFGQTETNNVSKSTERGKTLSLNNGHSILGDNNKFNGGFINMIIMALLAGFASGAIITAIYIFTNLGKVAVSL